MNFYQTHLTEKLEEALKAVLPIIGIVMLLSFTITPIPPSILLLFLVGAVMLIIGMMFLYLRCRDSKRRLIYKKLSCCRYNPQHDSFYWLNWRGLY